MDLFKSLLKAEQAEALTADLSGRSFGCIVAVVADVADPANLGRIKVLMASSGAKSLSDWLVRLTPSKLISVPLVNVGDTVVVSFINGDPKNGVYLGVINNLPQPPAKDLATTVSVNGSSILVQTFEDTTVAVGNNIIKVDKDSITLTADQATLRLTSSTFVLSGVSTATINGKPIMVIGGKDSRGDTMSVSGI